MSQSLTVQCAHKTYPIFIKNNLFHTLDSTIDSREKKIALVTDETVYDLYGKELINKLATISQKVFPVVVKPGEESKSLETLAQVYKQLIDKGITKSDLIIALGGGVIGDLAGFAASTYLREVPYIQIPTTLLAQVDSSVGGKTAVNLPQGKNLIGSFYHPDAVFIDPLVLNTLPPRTFSDGLAEVIKYSMIQDAELFNLLAGHDSSSILPYMEDIITRCLDIKR
ncbi:MAG: 3-dehydroquinate synthase family protein, partial [Peptostreptococcales bacterium]